jgi:hypothetical protein
MSNIRLLSGLEEDINDLPIDNPTDLYFTTDSGIIRRNFHEWSNDEIIKTYIDEKIGEIGEILDVINGLIV